MCRNTGLHKWDNWSQLHLSSVFASGILLCRLITFLMTNFFSALWNFLALKLAELKHFALLSQALIVTFLVRVLFAICCLQIFHNIICFEHMSICCKENTGHCWPLEVLTWRLFEQNSCCPEPQLGLNMQDMKEIHKWYLSLRNQKQQRCATWSCLFLLRTPAEEIVCRIRLNYSCSRNYRSIYSRPKLNVSQRMSSEVTPVSTYIHSTALMLVDSQT